MGQRQISDVNVFLSERRGKQKQQPWGAVSAESDCYGSKPEGCVRASIWESESEWERETERPTLGGCEDKRTPAQPKTGVGGPWDRHSKQVALFPVLLEDTHSSGMSVVEAEFQGRRNRSLGENKWRVLSDSRSPKEEMVFKTSGLPNRAQIESTTVSREAYRKS